MGVYPTVALRPAAGALGLLGLVGLLAASCATGGASGDTEDIVHAVPFVDGERYVYDLVDADGEIVGLGTFTTSLQDDTYKLVQSYEEAEIPPGERPITDVSVVVVDADTLKPLTTERTIQQRDPKDDESYSATYVLDGDNGPQLVVKQVRDGKERTRTLDLQEHYYESQSALWIWRAIAFADDFEANYVNVNPMDASQATWRLATVDRQTIDVPAGTFETWRLQVRNGRDTRVVWIDVKPPHAVVQWDNGTLFLRLAEVSTP